MRRIRPGSGRDLWKLDFGPKKEPATAAYWWIKYSLAKLATTPIVFTMDRMWSPWRSRHIERLSKGQHGKEDRETLFVRIGEAEDDEKNLVVWRGEQVYVVMNLFPYNNGHLLIVPYRPVEEYEELTSEEQIEIAATIERCIRWLREAINPDGFNVGMNLGRAAGAGVPEHLHVHVVPRWSGDTNFMPTTADMKVIPEAMQDTFAKLRAAAAGTGNSTDSR